MTSMTLMRLLTTYAVLGGLVLVAVAPVHGDPGNGNGGGQGNGNGGGNGGGNNGAGSGSNSTSGGSSSGNSTSSSSSSCTESCSQGNSTSSSSSQGGSNGGNAMVSGATGAASGAINSGCKPVALETGPDHPMRLTLNPLLGWVYINRNCLKESVDQVGAAIDYALPPLGQAVVKTVHSLIG
ncbi:MAG: hypothetical protein V4510_00870 [bacterium]